MRALLSRDSSEFRLATSIAAALWLSALGALAVPAPDFELSEFHSGRTHRLADHAGEIVLVDFFAFWCPPCRESSQALEKEIRRHYEARGGNPHGVPVSVIGINVEARERAKTAAFIEETGLGLALDGGGDYFKQFSAEDLPFFLIIDGTKTRDDAPVFEIVRQVTGYPGIQPLRSIIDSIGGSTQPSAPPAETKTPLSQPSSLARRSSSHSVELSSEWMQSDIRLSFNSIRYRGQSPRSQWSAEFAAATIDFDYRPIPADIVFGFGSPAPVAEKRLAGQLQGGTQLNNRLQLLGGIGVYDGFPEHRSVWFDRFNRQRYLGVPIPGDSYAIPEPHGFNLSTGLRWEYRPASGFLEARYGFGQDHIAPGYSIDAAGLHRGPTILNTTRLSLSSENVISRRARLLTEASLVFTSTRDVRYSLKTSLNFALTDRWTLRAHLGGAKEDPSFEAYYTGATVERELNEHWAASFDASVYRDLGEIENSAFSTAAPGLDTLRLGLGIRRAGRRSSWKLFAGPYFSDYAPFGLGTAFFSGLYQDRSWVIVQGACSFQF